MAENFLLVRDLDDAVLGDRAALERFHEYQASCGPRLAIVYVSRRFFESVSEDVRTTPLLEPIAVIGGVGSEMRSYPDGKHNQAWIERISNLPRDGAVAGPTYGT